ncbi:MAG: molecular chaperone Hsp20 [Treponema sp.]|nr:MAG: molecular chaperone Hsp20 [Treponema sp.]
MKNTLSIFSPGFADELISDLNTGFGMFAPVKRAMPSVDVRETEDAYIMDIELPGLDEKDVELNLHDKVLTISSNKIIENEKKSDEKLGEYLIRERTSQSFSRKFTLPEDINSEDVKAEFEKGILTINIPRKPETKPRKISITKK